MMNQPPSPPPPPSAERQIHISRDGTVLGAWPASMVRTMLVSGDLKMSDYSWYDGAEGWERLIPDSPCDATPYPYIGDSHPLYFIREGFLYGPRTDMEIALLRLSGWLTDEVLITSYAAERWMMLKDFMPLDAVKGTADGISDEEPKFDWISHGIRAYVGDPIAGAAIGMHAAKKALAWIAAASNPDVPHQHSSIPMFEDGSKVKCARCTALILPATAHRNGGVCFKCKPRRKLP